MRLNPLLAKDWFPEILLDVSDEKYFEGKRVSQVIQLERYSCLVAIWDEPGYYFLERSNKTVVKIEDHSFDNNNVACNDLFLFDAGKNSLNSKFRNAFAVSRTLNAINFIDIKGQTVHTMLEVKNSSSRNQRMILLPLEGGNSEELFKLIFIREHTNHKK